MKNDLFPARWWHRLSDGRLQCDVCPRECKLGEGQRGFCVVRARHGEQMVLTTYGRSSGYIHKAPREEFFAHIDAANVDLKAFSENFYNRIAFAHLQPVLETLEYLARGTKVWLEVTTLLIPGHNDSEREVTELSEWMVEKLGPNVPLHFSGFHPNFKMRDVPATPPATLRRARDRAMAAGLRYVYVGNTHYTEGETTYCPSCREALLVRDWYELLEYRLTKDGRCPKCQTSIAGRFDAAPGNWGRRRLPVNLRSQSQCL